jgi:hypothetical protein
VDEVAGEAPGSGLQTGADGEPETVPETAQEGRLREQGEAAQEGSER